MLNVQCINSECVKCIVDHKCKKSRCNFHNSQQNEVSFCNHCFIENVPFCSVDDIVFSDLYSHSNEVPTLDSQDFNNLYNLNQDDELITNESLDPDLNFFKKNKKRRFIVLH